MKETRQLTSKDGHTALNCLKWTPTTQQAPRAILQIIHGMAEYIERYDDFATFLTTQNIVVVGHDHLGHGQSVSENSPRYGYFSEAESANILIEDAFQLTSATKKDYPDIPYFVLGHSMGSFVLRNYLMRYADDLSGAIIMGTAGYRADLKIALSLAKLLNQVAPKKENALLDKLAFGSFAKSFPEQYSGFDWLSKNQTNVIDYINDPQLGFIFTNNGFYTLFTLMAKATAPNWYKNIPLTLPFYLISGEQDPVGNFGKGPRAVALELTQAGFEDVTLQLYRELRHEILNELEQKQVMTDIASWLTKHLD